MTQDPSQSIDLSAPFVEQLDRRHRLIRLFVLCLFTAALTGGLIITQINVKRGLIVYSSDPSQWSIGQKIPLRIEGRSLPFRQTIRLQDVTVSFKPILKDLKPPSTPPQHLSAAIEQMWQGEITLPDKAGKYRLIVEAQGFEHPSLTKGQPSELPILLNAQIDFTLNETKQSPPLWPPLAQTPTTARARLGKGTLSFYPADQRLSSELPSTLFIVAQREGGTPWRGELELEQIEGMIANELPEQVKTKSNGLAQLDLTPQSMSIRLRAQANIEDREDENEDQNSDEVLTSCDERFQPRAHQFNLIPSTQLVKTGGLLSFKVQSTYLSDHLYVDLWWGDQWLSTSLVSMFEVNRADSMGGLKSEGQGVITIPELPKMSKTGPQLLWVQAYLLPYQIDEVRGGAYLVWSPQDTTKEAISTWLKDQFIAGEMEPSAYWTHLSPEVLLSKEPLRLGLGRLMRPATSPEVMINSGESAQLTAKKQRSRYMKLYLEFMAALCVVTMMWLITLVTLTYRKQVTHPEWSDPQSVKRARKIAVTWLAPMMIILMVFFGAMILLVFKVSW